MPVESICLYLCINLKVPGILWPDKWIPAFKSIFIKRNQERVEVLKRWSVNSSA